MNRQRVMGLLSAHRAWYDSRGTAGERLEVCGVDWSGIDLGAAFLRGAIITNSSLQHASFRQANLIAACLEWCDLRSANFEHAMMDSVRLTGSDVRRACFKGVGLMHARLKGVTYTRDSFEGARLLCDNCGRNTKDHAFPEGKCLFAPGLYTPPLL